MHLHIFSATVTITTTSLLPDSFDGVQFLSPSSPLFHFLDWFVLGFFIFPIHESLWLLLLFQKKGRWERKWRRRAWKQRATTISITCKSWRKSIMGVQIEEYIHSCFFFLWRLTPQKTCIFFNIFFLLFEPYGKLLMYSWIWPLF